MSDPRALVIHSSKLMAEIIRRHLVAEFAHVTVALASTLEEAEPLLVRASYAAVLVDDALPGASAAGLADWLGGAPGARRARIVAVGSEALPLGAAHGRLRPPFTALDVRAALEDVFEGRGRRGATRVAIPGARVALEAGALTKPAQLVNLSESGLLLEWSAAARPEPLLGGGLLHLTLPEGFAARLGGPVRWELLRLVVLERQGEHPTRLQAAVLLPELPEAARAELRAIVAEAERSLEAALPPGAR
jgi:hypothetical protein